MSELSYVNISFLTFQATVQVICICITGYVCARTGLLSPLSQKSISLLNVNVFTPALIFSKLASSLSLKKMIEVSVIPVFFAISTFVSVMCSRFTSKLLKLNEPETDFVTAMSAFGNSNSLPVSLTIALAYTLPNLEWDILDDDNADKIAGRGILYLLIFQQLGQVLRWSWGFNTLLRRRSHKELNSDPYSDNPEQQETFLENSGEETLISNDELEEGRIGNGDDIVSGNADNNKISFNSDRSFTSESAALEIENETQHIRQQQASGRLSLESIKEQVSKRFTQFLNFMNPPLYAMALSVIVASIPALHDSFYVNDGFVEHTIASAIKDLGSVSIPLILVVLGSNLAPSSEMAPASKNHKKIIFGSLISRMILPPIVLLPFIAICVKYVEISILDDPIFLIVSFILTISPPAIQLSQICQLNEIYEMEMAGVLFWGYVVLTLPTTIVIVVSSLEVLDWAGKLMK